VKGSVKRGARGNEVIEENLRQFLMLKEKYLEMEERGRRRRNAR
jgi:hypothetical protein